MRSLQAVVADGSGTGGFRLVDADSGKLVLWVRVWTCPCLWVDSAAEISNWYNKTLFDLAASIFSGGDCSPFVDCLLELTPEQRMEGLADWNVREAEWPGIKKQMERTRAILLGKKSGLL
jgi:hypothetical protein